MLKMLVWVASVIFAQLLDQDIGCFVIVPVMSQSSQFEEEGSCPLEDLIDTLREQLSRADAQNTVYRAENRDLEVQVDKLMEEKIDLEAQVNFLQQRMAEQGEENRRLKMTHWPKIMKSIERGEVAQRCPELTERHMDYILLHEEERSSASCSIEPSTKKARTITVVD